MRPRLPQTPLRRLTQALWAALYVLGLVCSSAHFSLVAHRVCEHGEVVHGAAHLEQGLDAGLESPAHASNEDSRAHTPLDEPDDEQHEHCELEPGTQVAPPVELARLAFAQFLEEFFGPRVVPTPCAPSIAILRLAPGHSPPTA